MIRVLVPGGVGRDITLNRTYGSNFVSSISVYDGQRLTHYSITIKELFRKHLPC